MINSLHFIVVVFTAILMDIDDDSRSETYEPKSSGTDSDDWTRDGNAKSYKNKVCS